jgi:hypothetical protein
MTAIPGGNDDGFRIVNAVLALSETADLLRTLESSALTRSRAGARHLIKHPVVSDVANDPRLLAIASAFLGPSAVPFRTTLFEKSSTRNWLVPEPARRHETAPCSRPIVRDRPEVGRRKSNRVIPHGNARTVGPRSPSINDFTWPGPPT